VLGQLPGATEDEVFAETFEDGEGPLTMFVRV
jgi:hypothetical protein